MEERRRGGRERRAGAKTRDCDSSGEEQSSGARRVRITAVGLGLGLRPLDLCSWAAGALWSLGKWAGHCSMPVSKPTKYRAVLGPAQRAEMVVEPGPGLTRVVSCSCSAKNCASCHANGPRDF
jgi:hypothetical protein